MSLEARLLVALAASPLLLVATQSLLSRAARDASPQSTALWSTLLASVPTGVLATWAAAGAPIPVGRAASTVVYCALLYACTAVIYFHLVNMSETARRIHLLALLCARSTVRAADLASEYGEDEVLDARLERLVRLRALSRAGDVLCDARGPLLWAAVIVLGWRRIVLPREGD